MAAGRHCGKPFKQQDVHRVQYRGKAVLAADMLLRQGSPSIRSSGKSGRTAVARGWRTCVEVGNLPRLPLEAAELIAEGLSKALHQRLV